MNKKFKGINLKIKGTLQYMHLKTATARDEKMKKKYSVTLLVNKKSKDHKNLDTIITKMKAEYFENSNILTSSNDIRLFYKEDKKINCQCNNTKTKTEARNPIHCAEAAADASAGSAVAVAAGHHGAVSLSHSDYIVAVVENHHQPKKKGLQEDATKINNKKCKN